MKRTLIAVLIGALLTPLMFAVAGLLGAACHCVTPTTFFFPYGVIVLERFSAESLSLLTMAISVSSLCGGYGQSQRTRTEDSSFTLTPSVSCGSGIG